MLYNVKAVPLIYFKDALQMPLMLLIWSIYQVCLLMAILLSHQWEHCDPVLLPCGVIASFNIVK